MGVWQGFWVELHSVICYVILSLPRRGNLNSQQGMFCGVVICVMRANIWASVGDICDDLLNGGGLAVPRLELVVQMRGNT